MEEIFCLVDCNNFYVSCERVFNPRLIGKPVVVLSNNDGCIVSRSNEAKELGIKMGSPLFMIKNLIKQHNVEVFSSNYALYGDMSQRVMNTLQRFVPDIELYSIDEAFLLMENKNLLEFGKVIKDTVKRDTGIPVSLGFGPTKTLAKLANRFVKKYPHLMGILDITNHRNFDDLLTYFDVADIWGIGSQYSELLKSNGINTAYDLKNADEYWVKQNMTVVGARTVFELRGISCLKLEQVMPRNKTLIRSGGFGRPVQKLSELKEALSFYVARGAEKLRRSHSIASSIKVFINTNHFNTTEPQYSNCATIRLPLWSNHTGDLINYALSGLESIYKSGFNYKRAGIMFEGILPEEKYQYNFFFEKDTKRDKNLMVAIDKINARFGKDTIRFAATGIEREWKQRQSRRSPLYTTSWKDLLVVKSD
jgi:DNA polymerase V